MHMNKNIVIGFLVAIILIGGYFLITRNAQEKTLQAESGQAAAPVRAVTDDVVPRNGETPVANPSSTHVYKNHGFAISLPNGYAPTESPSEGGPSTSISLPNDSRLSYVSDAAFWVKNVIPSYAYVNAQKIGQTTFSVYSYNGKTLYWFRQGNVGYEFSGDAEILKTFKFVGWN